MNTTLVGMLLACVAILGIAFVTNARPSLVSFGSKVHAVPINTTAPVSYMSATGESTSEYKPESWLSSVLGLDKHPGTLAAINNTLRTAATDAGIPASVVGSPDATAANPGGTPGTAVASSPTSLLSIIEHEGVAVGVPALKTIVGDLVAKIPDISTQDKTDIDSFLSTLIDNVVAGEVAKAAS